MNQSLNNNKIDEQDTEQQVAEEALSQDHIESRDTELGAEINTELDTEQAAIEKRREHLKSESTRIIDIANNEANSALKCIHQLSVAGGATEPTYVAIEQRIVADQDPAGAYHLALLAQNTPDLPIDARQLIELVVKKGDNAQLLALLKNLPLPPVDIIKERVLASNDGEAIGQMNAYLQINPEGYGSQHMLASGQADRIVPLSPASNINND